MNPEWKLSRKELVASFWLLLVSIGLMFLTELTRSPQVNFLPALLTGFLLWIFLCLFIFLPFKFVPIITRRTDERGSLNGSTQTGRKIFRSILIIYLSVFLTLQVLAALQPDSKFLFWRILGGAIFLALLWSVSRGIRETRHFVSYLFILGAVFFYRIPGMFQSGYLPALGGIHLIVGFVFGLVLLLSRDVGAYLTERYKMMPPVTRERIERKRTKNKVK